MSLSIQQICPSLQELFPKSSHVDVASKKSSVLPAKKSKNTGKVINQFHCPVQSCLYACDSSRFFTQLTYLRQHVRKVHLPKSHTCVKCDKHFAVLSDYTRHSQMCGTVFACGTCEKKYSSKEALLTHVKRKFHATPFDSSRKKCVSVETFVKKDATIVSSESFRSQCLMLVVTPPVKAAFEKESISSNTPRLILPKPKQVNEITSSKRTSVQNELEEVDSNNRSEDIPKRALTNCEKCLKLCRKNANQHKQKEKLGRLKFELSGSRSKKITNLLTSYKNKGVQAATISTLLENRIIRHTASQTDFICDFCDKVSSVTVSENEFITEYPIGTINNHIWSCGQHSLNSNVNKSNQSKSDLEVETRFTSVAITASTQTSPQDPKIAADYLYNGRILDSPLNKYFGYDLGNLHDPVFSSSSRYPNSPLLTTDCSARLLSSETQTDQQFENTLRLDADGQSDSDIDIEETLSFDIHTQTPRDLESIPYDQFLTNMETQTSDPFLLSALALCDIETQTAVLKQNESVGLVDMHTQTYCQQDWRQDAHVTDMETQTFIPNLETGLMDSHTQTPGSWSSLLDIFSDY